VNTTSAPKTLILASNNLTGRGTDMSGIEELAAAVGSSPSVSTLNLSNNHLCGGASTRTFFMRSAHEMGAAGTPLAAAGGGGGGGAAAALAASPAPSADAAAAGALGLGPLSRSDTEAAGVGAAAAASSSLAAPAPLRVGKSAKLLGAAAGPLEGLVEPCDPHQHEQRKGGKVRRRDTGTRTWHVG
jgi:hypothetical protein